MEAYDEKIIYLGVTTNTYGDWIKINNSDRFYDIIKGKMNDIEVMVYAINMLGIYTAMEVEHTRNKWTF